MAFKILTAKEKTAIKAAIEAKKAEGKKRALPKSVTELLDMAKAIQVGDMFFYPVDKEINVMAKRANVEKTLVKHGYPNCVVAINPINPHELVIESVEPDKRGEDGVNAGESEGAA